MTGPIEPHLKPDVPVLELNGHMMVLGPTKFVVRSSTDYLKNHPGVCAIHGHLERPDDCGKYLIIVHLSCRVGW